MAIVPIDISRRLSGATQADERLFEGVATARFIARPRHQAARALGRARDAPSADSTHLISSRSCVATSTVVPLALMSRNRFMISSDKSGSRLPVGSSARTSCGSLTSARAIATRCCSPPDSSGGIGVEAVLQPDPLQHLIRAPALLLDRRAEHAQREADVLEHRLGRASSLKSWKTKPTVRR